MLEMIDIGVENVVAYRLEGKITEDEMKSILTVFKEKIEKGEKLNVYQEIVSIGGVELDAMIEKFKFFRDVGFSHFDKIAVVVHTKRTLHADDEVFRFTRSFIHGIGHNSGHNCTHKSDAHNHHGCAAFGPLFFHDFFQPFNLGLIFFLQGMREKIPAILSVRA